MVPLSYAYEDPYAVYPEDIQYTTDLPLVSPIPYTYQWNTGWGSANEFGEDEEEKKKWWQKIDFEAAGKVIKKLPSPFAGKKTKRSAKKSSRKKRKSKKGKSSSVFKPFNPLFKKIMDQAPDLDSSFQIYQRNSKTGQVAPIPFGNSAFALAVKTSRLGGKGQKYDKDALPPRTSNLFQQTAVQSQPIVKAVQRQLISPASAQSQSQLTARSQESEKALKSKEKSDNTMVAIGAVLGILAVGGGSFYIYNKRKQQGGQNLQGLSAEQIMNLRRRI